MLARLALHVWLPAAARLLLSLLAPIMPIEAHAAEPQVVTVAPSRQAAGLALYPVNGPPGAMIALAQHPTQPEQLWAIAAATTPSGLTTALYRSQDGGASWEPGGNDLSWLRLTALAVSPAGTLFLGTSDGLYMRRAADKVWRRVALEDAPTGSEKLPWPTQGVTIQQILLAGANAAHIYVVAAENPKYARYWILRSYDGGQSFERFLIQELSSGPGSGLGHILMDPDDENWLYATTRGGVLISSDGGATWTPGGLDPSLTEGMTVAAMPPNQPDALLAVRAVRDDQGVHLALAQSQDRGRTWSESALDLPKNVRPLDLVATPDGRLLLSTDSGVFVGLRDSKVWAAAGGDLSAMGAHQILADVAQPDVLWAATPLGVYRQSGAKAEWVTQNQGLPPNGRVQALYTSPEAPDVWLAAMARNKVGEIEPPAVLRTTDGGRSWHIANGLSGGRVNDFAGDPRQAGRVVAATYRGVCWSQDGGQSWSGCGLTDQPVQRVRIGPTGTLYAGTYGGGLYLSKDGGETWSQAGFAGMNITSMLVRTEGLYVAVQGSTSGLYRTQDDGASWQMLNWPAEPGVDVTQLTGNDQTLIAIVAGQGLWLSHDAGLTWTPAPGLPQDTTFDMVWVDPRTPTRVIAAPDDAGLWISEDGGRTWKAGGRTFGDNKVLAIAADYRTREDVVVATMMTGVWASGRGGRVSPPPDMVDARIEIVWPH